jgi:hypothetical protein
MVIPCGVSSLDFHGKSAPGSSNEHRFQFEADVRGSMRREELMATSDKKIHLGGTVLNGSRHFCAFFQVLPQNLWAMNWNSAGRNILFQCDLLLIVT